MNAKEFSIAHGEKVVVVVAAGLCGWMLIGTFTNPEIRPGNNLSMELINGMVAKVENRRNNAVPPQMQAVPTYLDDMKTRWANDLPTGEYIAWLSAEPDVGPPDVEQLRLYVYELLPPKVEAKDAIGSVDLIISPPQAPTAQDPRVDGGSKKAWNREKHPDNTAEQLGVKLEMKVGGGMWKPVVAKGVGPDGFIAFAKDGISDLKISVETLEAWERYSFRARLLAKATGLALGKAVPNDAEQTVLVYQGVYPEDPVDWPSLTPKVSHGDPEILKRFSEGFASGPASNLLKPGELLYASLPSDEANLQATSATRFVFWKSSADPADPDSLGATILLTKLMRNAQGEGKWLAQPEVFKLTKGKHLGEERNVIDPWRAGGIRAPAALETPFDLVEVQKDVKRILYYEVVVKSRPNGGKDKDLEIKEKDQQTEVAVFVNPTSSAKQSYAKLSRIAKPQRANAIVYPNYPSEVYDEEEEFKKNPANFQQWGLIPAKPIAHDPDTGPLEELRKKRGDDLLKTDTAYYELADGRLVFWENVNHRLRIEIIPGSEADKKPEKPADAAPPSTPGPTPSPATPTPNPPPKVAPKAAPKPTPAPVIPPTPPPQPPPTQPPGYPPKR